MPINSLINDENVLASGFIPEPRANVPSLSELNALSFDYNRKTLLSSSESSLISKQRNNRDDLFYKTTGKKVSEVIPGASIVSPQTIDRDLDQLILSGRETDPEKYNQIPTFDEMQQSAVKEAQTAQTAYQEARQLRDGFGAGAVDFASGMYAQFYDPVNIAAIPFGVSRSASLLRTVLGEAAINAGADLVVQPDIADWQRKIGNDYGLGDMAASVGMNALFGASIGGLTHSAINNIPSAVFSRMAENDKLGPLHKMAAKYMERYADLNESVPVNNPTITQRDLHFDTLNKVVNAFENGKPLSSVNIKFTYDDLVNKLKSGANTDLLGRIGQDIAAPTKTAIDSAIAKISKAIDVLKSPEVRFDGDAVRNRTLSEYVDDEGGFKVEPWMVAKYDRLGKIENQTGIIEKGNSSGQLIQDMANKAQDAGFLVKLGFKPNSTQRITPEQFFDVLAGDVIGAERYFSSAGNKLNKIRPDLRRAISDLDKAGIDWRNLDRNTIVKQYADKLSGVKRLDIQEPDSEFMQEFFFEKQIKTAVQIDEELKSFDSPEYHKAYDADTKRFVDEFADEVVVIDDRQISIKELMDQAKKDDDFLSQITSCAV